MLPRLAVVGLASVLALPLASSSSDGLGQVVDSESLNRPTWYVWHLAVTAGSDVTPYIFGAPQGGSLSAGVWLRNENESLQEVGHVVILSATTRVHADDDAVGGVIIDARAAPEPELPPWACDILYPCNPPDFMYFRIPFDRNALVDVLLLAGPEGAPHGGVRLYSHGGVRVLGVSKGDASVEREFDFHGDPNAEAFAPFGATSTTYIENATTYHSVSGALFGFLFGYSNVNVSLSVDMPAGHRDGGGSTTPIFILFANDIAGSYVLRIDHDVDVAAWPASSPGGVVALTADVPVGAWQV